MEHKRVYGIDLGTTYSCISYVESSGKPIVVQNAEGDLTTPSVVYFETKDNIVVGKAAKEVAEVYPDQVVSRVKRLMGDPKIKVLQHGEEYIPQRISAAILRKIVGDAEKIMQVKIEDVVITCPAYFGINQREATKQAGELAGLNVRAIINEPTAAALAYGFEQGKDQTLLIYDLGGGTFDVTILRIEGNSFTVVASDGNDRLGGVDWDELLARHFAASLEDVSGTPRDEIIKDKETLQQLLVKAEEAKIALSSATNRKVVVTHDASRAVVNLSRDEFDRLTHDLLEKTIQYTKQALQAAKEKGAQTIDKVLLVGGSSYMPQVMNRVKKEFSCDVLLTDPNQIVAKGAALYALREQVIDELAPVPGAPPVAPDSPEGDRRIRRWPGRLAPIPKTCVV